jgi:prepilin-type N-terminal cleavage/methylation domain-containing protein
MAILIAEINSPVAGGQDGFTIVETVVVMVILAVLTVATLSRLPSLDEHTQQIEINTLKSHLRFVQNRAMGSETMWSIHFDASNTYRFMKDGVNSTMVPPGADIADAKLNPDNDSLTVNLAGLKVVIPSGNGHDDRINFDKVGSPVENDGTILASDIIVQDDGGNTLFLVTAHTGFVE